MRNSTISLSPVAIITIAFMLCLYFVITTAGAHILNSATSTEPKGLLAHSHGDYGDDPELDMAVAADLLSTCVYVLDESLTVAIDTANYTFAVYDNAGTSGGMIESVDWSGDTCNVHVGDDYVFSILKGSIVFAGEK